jgi:PAS domain S-box-containing protein
MKNFEYEIGTQSTELMRMLVQNVTDYAIIALDTSGHVLSWNEGARRINGYEESEILGQHFSIFYPEKDRDTKPSLELKTALSEGRFEEEGWRIRKDGTPFWVNAVVTPIYDDSKQLIGFAKITRDLTERLAATELQRQTEEVFRLMVDAVKDYAIFLLTPEGIVFTWNEGARRINGYESSEIIGKHFSEFYTQEDKARNHPEEELEQARRQGAYQEEGWRIRKDGTTFWASVTITAVHDGKGELRGFAKVTRDLTERRQAELELENARDEAIKASNLKSQFVANVSHEVRTPMAGIIGMAEQLVEDETLDADQREAAEHVFMSSKRLLEVLNDLLDFSKLEAGRVELEESTFRPDMMFQEIVDSIYSLARKKGLQVTSTLDPSLPKILKGDEAKIRRAMLNLSHNAVKFTKEGKIAVSAELVERDADDVVVKFQVIDTGIGISPEAREKLFEPFVQADGTVRRKFGGTGLGLSITKRYVDLMSGQIGLDTQEDSGSTFWFTVPLKVAQ